MLPAAFRNQFLKNFDSELKIIIMPVLYSCQSYVVAGVESCWKHPGHDLGQCSICNPIITLVNLMNFCMQVVKS